MTVFFSHLHLPSIPHSLPQHRAVFLQLCKNRKYPGGGVYCALSNILEIQSGPAKSCQSSWHYSVIILQFRHQNKTSPFNCNRIHTTTCVHIFMVNQMTICAGNHRGPLPLFHFLTDKCCRTRAPAATHKACRPRWRGVKSRSSVKLGMRRYARHF